MDPMPCTNEPTLPRSLSDSDSEGYQIRFCDPPTTPEGDTAPLIRAPAPEAVSGTLTRHLDADLESVRATLAYPLEGTATRTTAAKAATRPRSADEKVSVAHVKAFGRTVAIGPEDSVESTIQQILAGQSSQEPGSNRTTKNRAPLPTPLELPRVAASRDASHKAAKAVESVVVTGAAIASTEQVAMGSEHFSSSDDWERVEHPPEEQWVLVTRERRR
ncbi:hypothetical protein LTR53_013316 [Teratosphaeriaceae sp. CCFEE 6253]|nr:hypothetical protein LTR53_013316 [Teratosphaeriaceae sp. CCFEE 6253]